VRRGTVAGFAAGLVGGGAGIWLLMTPGDKPGRGEGVPAAASESRTPSPARSAPTIPPAGHSPEAPVRDSAPDLERHLSVEVVHFGGLPLEGAQVDLFSPWPAVVNLAGPLPGARVRATSDATGIATLEGSFHMEVRPGEWAIIVNGLVWWRDIDCNGKGVDVGTRGIRRNPADAAGRPSSSREPHQEGQDVLSPPAPGALSPSPSAPRDCSRHDRRPPIGIGSQTHFRHFEEPVDDVVVVSPCPAESPS